MRTSLLLTFLLSILITVGVVHALASFFHLYYRYPLLDMPLHFLGGCAIAFSFYLLPMIHIRLPSKYHTLVYILLASLSIGVVWELFELTIGETSFAHSFLWDSARDMCMNLIGSTVGYYFVKQFHQF